MEFFLVRRQLLAVGVGDPFRCACGSDVGDWDAFREIEVVNCRRCPRPEYQLLATGRNARELVILARGVLDMDAAAFQAQGFHVLRPSAGGRFPGVPYPIAELTSEDGSLKGGRLRYLTRLGAAGSMAAPAASALVEAVGWSQVYRFA